MILTRNHTREVYNYLNETKTISRLGFTEVEFAQWGHTLNGINALTDEQTLFNGTTRDEFEIDTIFEGAIVSGKITLSGSEEEMDLRSEVYEQYDGSKYGFDGLSYLKPTKFEAISRAILGSRRLTPSTKSVDELKAAVAITSVNAREMRDGYVVKSGSAYFPLTFKFPIKEDIYFNYPAGQMLVKWFKQQLNNKQSNK